MVTVMIYKLQQIITTPYLNTFESIITDKNKFRFVYQYLKKNDLIPTFRKDVKCDSISISYRKDGNDDFLDGKHLEAVMNYTRSLAWAESAEVKALAYCNRSACLFMLGMYKQCLEDIERALELNVPEIIRRQLNHRRRSAGQLYVCGEDYHESLPRLTDSLPETPYFSSSLQIVENQEFGTHVVATKDIQIGEVVALEPPVVSVLLEDFLLHCHHCLYLCYNPIPCPDCTQALFCSEECLHDAQNTYHRYECPLLLTFSDCDILLVTLRVVTMNIELNMKTGEEHLRNENLHHVSALAAVLFHHLKNQTDFYRNEASVGRFQENIIKIILMLRLNSTKVSEYRQKKDGNYYHHFFAAVLYEFSSLFNHSCCHNIERYYFGSTVVLAAIKSIRKGQQLFINYGYPYYDFSKEQRQQELKKKYFFKCKCEACENDWKPPLGEFSSPKSAARVIKNKFLQGDVSMAKKWLPHLIPLLRQCEPWEPLGPALILRKMICSGFDCLGNKRRI